VLDASHRQMLFSLGKLSALIARLATFGPDAEARAMANEIVTFFSTTVRQHHEDEERHVFPKMAASADPDTVRTVLRLQQDHDWLEGDWMELSPHLDAVAAGQSCAGHHANRTAIDPRRCRQKLCEMPNCNAEAVPPGVAAGDESVGT